MTIHECESSRMALGALVLGALAPDEREDVNRHIAECPSCRAELAELAPLPGLLHLVRPEDIPANTADVSPSPQLEESVLAAASARESGSRPESGSISVSDQPGAPTRTRRPRVITTIGAVAAAAAVVVAAAIGIVALVTGSPADDSGDVVTASATDPRSDVTVEVELTPVPEGTDVSVEVTGAVSGHECDLVVVSSDGTDDLIASWTTDYVGTANVTGHTSLTTGLIDRLDVTTEEGVLLTIPVQ